MRFSDTYLTPLQETLIRMRAINPPEPVNFEHHDLIRGIDDYMKRLQGEIPPFSRTNDLVSALLSLGSSNYEACLDIQRSVTEQGVEENIGCDDEALGVVRQCASSYGIPRARPARTREDAQSEAERIVGVSLPIPDDLPSSVAAFGVDRFELREPDDLDGGELSEERRANDDVNASKAMGAVVEFSGVAPDDVRVYVAYARLPDCFVPPTPVTLSNGTTLLYEAEGRGEESGADIETRTYQAVRGTFPLEDLAISISIEYTEPGAPSRDEQVRDLVEWAERVITVERS